MRDVILAQLDASRAVLVLAEQGPLTPELLAAGLACHDAAAALIAAWGNLDDAPPPPEDEGAECRHRDRISTATHGDPKAWMCRDCGFNATDSAPPAQGG